MAGNARSWTRRLGTVAVAVPVLALLGFLAVPPGSASTAAPGSASAPGITHQLAANAPGVTYYAVGKPLCKRARPGHFTCFAVRRVEVKKGTPGAEAYHVAAGASPSAAASGANATIGPAGGLTPFDLGSAYAYNSAGRAKGQTVAIVDAYNDPKINSDLQVFDTHYGLKKCSTSNGCLRVVNQHGGSALPPDDVSGWSGEETLDVETVHAVCQNCKIILLEATVPSAGDLEAAVNEAVKLKATEVSNSYGGPEGRPGRAEKAAYNHPGVVITASSGDDGYYNYDIGGPDQANAPASLSTVVAVGGTSLYLGQTAVRQSESVWNDNGVREAYEGLLGALGASGGGCSASSPAPSWQSSLSAWQSTGCGTHRLVADIAADADYLTGLDIYDTYVCGIMCPGPGWSTIGGTSLSSPLIAAMFGLAGGAHGVAYPALTLYGHLGSSSLYDVTTGGNGFCDGEGAAECGDPNSPGSVLDCDYPATGTTPSPAISACDALPGFDGPTGVGTPDGLGAFAKTGPAAAISGPTSVPTGTARSWTARASDPFPGGRIVSYTWNWGDGSAMTVGGSDSAAHTYSAGSAGVTRTITLSVKDSYGQTRTITYSVRVS
jgi:hypothetical protein